MNDSSPEMKMRGAGGSNKPTITVSSGGRHTAVDSALRALLEMEVEIYQRQKQLVRCAVVPAKSSDGTVIYIPGIIEISRPWLERQLGMAARWQKPLANNKLRVIDPPSEVADQILSMVGEWPFEPLLGVIGTPTMRPDGSLLLHSGYDKATGYYMLNPPSMPPIPEEPTRDDAISALEVLKALLPGFPFVDGPSRSVGLSGLMTPVLRAAMPVAPAHTFSAPDAGYGKSYLMDTVTMIALGTPCPVLSMTNKDEKECEKRLIGAALSGDPIISMDNLTVTVEGDFYCQLTERPMLKPRPLGTSVMPVIPNSFTVFCNGNNLSISGDATRRTLRGKLDANVENAIDRKFSFSPTAMIKSDRGRYIAAVLTITRAYIVAGKPNLQTLPSYDEWSAYVRSALIWLGEADPVDTLKEVKEDDHKRAVKERFFEAWATELTQVDGGWLTKELIAAACALVPHEWWGTGEKKHPEFYEVMVEIAGARYGSDGPIDTLRLGHWLKSAKDTITSGRKLVRNDSDKKRPRWMLIDVLP